MHLYCNWNEFQIEKTLNKILLLDQYNTVNGT